MNAATQAAIRKKTGNERWVVLGDRSDVHGDRSAGLRVTISKRDELLEIELECGHWVHKHFGRVAGVNGVRVCSACLAAAAIGAIQASTKGAIE